MGENQGTYPVSSDLITAVDRLTSLYAYDLLDGSVKDRLEALSASEADGMKVLQNNHRTVRALEMNRLPKGKEAQALRFNAWKGYVPSTPKAGVSIEVKDASEHEKMIMMGYTKVGEYQGDASERFLGKRGIYRSSVGAKSAYRQGVAQTVHPTWFGVDARTGYDRTGETAGRLSAEEARTVKMKGVTARRGLVPGEYLMPVWNEKGQLRGFDRSLSSQHQAMLEQNRGSGSHDRCLDGAYSGRGGLPRDQQGAPEGGEVGL